MMNKQKCVKLQKNILTPKLDHISLFVLIESVILISHHHFADKKMCQRMAPNQTVLFAI